MTELHLELPRDSSAARVARLALADRLPALSPGRLADLKLLVTELVSNAVLHGRGAITLKIQHDDEVLRGEVIDQGGGFERELRERGADQVGGRGLLVVEALCSHWGIHEGTTHVWFEFSTREASDGLTEPRLGSAQRPDELDSPPA